MADRFDEILAEMRSERAEFRAERERDRAERERDRAEWSAKMDRRLDQTDENLRFLGELNRRSELVFQDVVRELRQMRRETRASRLKIEASVAEILARTADNTEMTKAHTQGIYALIDRLQGGSGGIAPAT